MQIDPSDLRIDVLPLVRSGRAERQHDRLRGAHHAPPDRHRGALPGREVAAQEQGQGDEGAALAAARGRAERAAGERANARRAQVGTGDRSEKIRTYNFPQSRVTDHRAGVTMHQLDALLAGDLDELLDAVQSAVDEQDLDVTPVRRASPARRAGAQQRRAQPGPCSSCCAGRPATSRERGIETARLDAECLLAHALGVDAAAPLPRLREARRARRERARLPRAGARAARASACRSRSWSGAGSSGRCRCASPATC